MSAGGVPRLQHLTTTPSFRNEVNVTSQTHATDEKSRKSAPASDSVTASPSQQPNQEQAARPSSLDTGLETPVGTVRSRRARLQTLRAIGWRPIIEASRRSARSRLRSEWKSYLMFRTARSRLWTPNVVPKYDFDEEKPRAATYEEWLEKTLEKHESRLPEHDIEGRIDEVLAPVWTQQMNDEQRESALIEVGFSCMERLGWREGYSAGYPATSQQMDLNAMQQFVQKSAARDKDGIEALEEVHSANQTLAWEVWMSMSPEQRKQEEIAAWAARDRTMLYKDDSPTCRVAHSSYPRWYATPQRAGHLVFLPNFAIRLVRNYTPPGQEYDVWKATFRVPLNLHKHAVRSFLLQVYGLRTTWIRSMVYRSPIEMDARRRKKVGTDRTFKKIEVGLLEPFVFPMLTPKQRSEDLYADEWDLRQSEALLQSRKRKFTKWRGGAPLPPRSPLASLDPWDLDLLDPKTQEIGLQKDREETLVSGSDKEKQAAKKAQRPFVTFRDERKWTTSHGNVLRVLKAKRLQRNTEVDLRAAAMKARRSAEAQ